MTEGLPAYDSNPEGLLELCKVLREGELEVEDLHEEIEERGEDSVNKNIDYGVKIGFLEKNDGKVAATKRGQTYGYGNLPDERLHQLFKDGIRDYEFYNEVMDIASEEIQEVNGSDSIVRDGITRELRINFEIDAGDRVLESAAGTFIKTLDAAGLGDYKRGTAEYPTRLEINDAFNDFYESITQSPSRTVGDSEDGNITTAAEKPEAAEESSQQSEEPENDGMESDDKNSSQGGQTEESSETTSQNQSLSSDLNTINSSIDVNIEIDISSADWEMEEVKEFIQDLQDQDDSE